MPGFINAVKYVCYFNVSLIQVFTCSIPSIRYAKTNGNHRIFILTSFATRNLFLELQGLIICLQLLVLPSLSTQNQRISLSYGKRKSVQRGRKENLLKKKHIQEIRKKILGERKLWCRPTGKTPLMLLIYTTCIAGFLAYAPTGCSQMI